jgi:hypothetical protein
LTFFFFATSHVVGNPFIFETMLRSGVPPHIGQSPVPGSDAAPVDAEKRIDTTQKTNDRNPTICHRRLIAFRLLTFDS